MRFFEKVLVVMIVIGLLFKLGLLPGTSALIGISVSLLATLYFAFGFLLFNGIRLRNVLKAESYEEVSATQLLIAITTGICLSITLMGSLFDFLFLPGADNMLIIGLTGLGILLLVCAFNIFKTGANSFNRRVLKRVVPVMFAGFILYSASVEMQVDFFYRNHPEYAKAFKEYLENPDNPELQRKLDEEREKMGD